MLIQDAISRVKKDCGVSSDDTTLNNRYIYHVLKSVRSTLLRQEIEKKGGAWANFPMQVLSKFKLQAIDIVECDEYVAGITVLKSKYTFPELLDTKLGKVLSGVFLPNGERLEQTTYTSRGNSINRRYKSNKPAYYFSNNHIYV